MAQKLSNLVTSVSCSQLAEKKIPYERICHRRNPIVVVPAKTYHAIVRDDETSDDIGIVFYQGKNGLPSAVFDRPARYTFIRQVNLTRTHSPERAY